MDSLSECVCMCVRACMCQWYIICLFIFVSDLTQLMVFDDSQYARERERESRWAYSTVAEWMSQCVSERAFECSTVCTMCCSSTLITTRRKRDTLLCFHHNQFIYITYVRRTSYMHRHIGMHIYHAYACVCACTEWGWC